MRRRPSAYRNSEGSLRSGILERGTTLIGMGVLGFLLFIALATAQERSSDGPVVQSNRSTLDEIQMAPAREDVPQWQKAGEANDTCLLPPLSLIQSQIVGAKVLAVPAKARKEYIAGCGALRKNKFERAEKHLRKAVDNYPEYVLAWTTLGQLLLAQKRNDLARAACSKGSAVDPSYTPAYLCLAEIAAQEEDWAEVVRFSGRALQLGPTAVAYLYNAAANLKIHKLEAAEQSALRALAIDEKGSDPREHFVLAQVYEAKGDRSKEISELQEYLKVAKNPEDIAYVKACLTRLERHAPADSAARN